MPCALLLLWNADKRRSLTLFQSFRREIGQQGGFALVGDESIEQG